MVDTIKEGQHVFDIEISAMRIMRDTLDSTFANILDLIINCKGKVIITGMGKPGHVATKIAATFSSLGTPSFFLHPAEAMHGDLGMVSRDDVVLAISYSGESNEIISILPNIKMIGATLVGITGKKNSTLAQVADIVQILPPFKEACYLGLAPTSSTTVEMAYGDALAVVASEIYGFSINDFGKFHPAGVLGKKVILKVDDLMSKGERNSVINLGANLKDAIIELSKKGLGVVSVIDNKGKLEGVITDGDLRRLLEKGVNVYSLNVCEVMSKKPIGIKQGKLAVDALKIMKEKNISCLPVLDGEKLIGTIRLQDIIGVGIVS